MGVHDGHRNRMRQRFMENDLNGFADHEALELLLFYAIPRGDVNPLAHALMERFGSLSGVLSAPVELLTQVEGVGERTAMLLRLVPQIAQKARLADPEREPQLTEQLNAERVLAKSFQGSSDSEGIKAAAFQA